jgi:hypothetical protein
MNYLGQNILLVPKVYLFRVSSPRSLKQAVFVPKVLKISAIGPPFTFVNFFKLNDDVAKLKA